MIKRVVIVGLLASVWGLTSAEAKEAGEWIELFNGKDLSGWKIGEHADSFSVQDGLMVVNGPRAHAFYVGPDGDASFENFHFKTEVMTTPGSNSGIYFHTRYLEEGWPNRGYEAQVNQTHGDPKKTGGLYDVQDNYDAVAKDNEWHDYEIIVHGKHIVVKINGEMVNGFAEIKGLTGKIYIWSQGALVEFRNPVVTIKGRGTPLGFEIAQP